MLLRILLVVLFPLAARGQLSVHIEAGKRVKDAQWFEVTVLSKHEYHILVSGEMILKTVSDKLELVPLDDTKYKAPARSVVVTREMTADLVKGRNQKTLVLAKPIVNFVPYDLLIDPPYLPPARFEKR